MAEMFTTSAVDAVAALRAGTVSPVDLVDVAEQRTRELQPVLRAMISTCFDHARDRAKRLVDRPGPLAGHPSWLAGLPVSVKDVVDVAGLPTTYGSAALREPARTSSPLVRRLSDLGALVVGKTSLPEFCSGPATVNELVGRTQNPWDPAVTCGASSGGAAVSVATGQVWCAHGEDTAGSIRLPAAFCGVVGIRPTPAAGELEVHGPLARDVRDAALFLDAMAGPGFLAAADRPALPRRVAFSVDYDGLATVDSEVREICTAAVRSLASAGCEVVESAPVLDAQRVHEAFGTLLTHRAAARYGPVVDRVGGGAGIRAEVAAGRAVTPDRLAAAEQERGRVVRAFAALFDRVDVLVTPAFGGPPWPASPEPADLARVAGGWPLTWLVSVAGCPSVCLPAGRSAAGHPVGLQLVGRPGADAALVCAASAVEQALGQVSGVVP
jgi:amidase